ncbi:hypothetical protein M436DRAFT_74829 [Aureobasidium namibiae CBS 147.97]|uniref:Uncharacterized protein n=1 Tax=Aureobasidium namibiae CBS 147.97 TaxID=1043004 RepID=A0A074WDG5_9PEZI
MSFLLASRPLGVGLGLGAAFTSYSLLRPRRNLLALCDSSAVFNNSYSNKAKTPVVNRKGGLSPNAGDDANANTGVLGGLAISLFSKPLTLLIGLLIIGVQFAESQLGVSLLPYNRLQRYFTSINLRSAMQENVAFKLAFGATFALTGFAQL